jgi:hypothetical protein
LANFTGSYNSRQSRQSVRLPVLTNEHINGFGGATINNESGNLYNCIIDKYSGEEDRVYATQRPSISMFDVASDTVTLHYSNQLISNWTIGETITGDSSGATGTIVADNEIGASGIGVLSVTPVSGTFTTSDNIEGGTSTTTADVDVVEDNNTGRGIYYWSAASARFFVNGTTIYKQDYDNPLAYWVNSDSEQTPMVAGTERVYFAEYESVNTNYLFIINPAATQIFIIDSTDSTLAINIKDIVDDSALGWNTGGAPLNASDTWDWTYMPIFTALGSVFTANSMAHGAVILDQYLFLPTKNGRIYNSALDDFLDWSTEEFVNVARTDDQLLAIEKTKDHILGMGERTTEILYDAGNASGSPLSVRTDVFYNHGIVSGEDFWADGDDVYFLGMKPSGDFALYLLRNFELQEISVSTLNSYLRFSRTTSSLETKVSGISSGGHVYVAVTVFNTDTNIPQNTLVFDTYSGLWYQWVTELNEHTTFPLLDWSIRTPEDPVTAEGIFYNGDLFSMADNFQPIDTTASTAYFAETYNEGGTYSQSTVDAGTTETNSITMKILITNIEVGTTGRKFLHSVEYLGNMPASAQTVTVRWSDNEGDNWYTGTIDLPDRTQINRLGSFNRRRFQMEFSGDEQLRIEGLELDYTQGD